MSGEAIQVFQGLEIKENIPLKEYTTMRVGGNAALYFEPASVSDIQTAVQMAETHRIPLLLLGNGSNTVVLDGGFDGLVIHLGEKFAKIEDIGNGSFIVQSGAKLPALSRLVGEQGYTGLEFACGIPGSIGGAVFMNAGAYGGEISQVIQSVTVLEDGKLRKYTSDEMEFSYRHSRLMETGGIVLSVCFQLKNGDNEQIIAYMNELNAKRREKQPISLPSAGSFFKRPQGYFAGALIEQCGLKGYSIHDAQVSEKHAGFIVNNGQATAQDIVDLMHHVQKCVFDQFGVTLEPEVRFVGNKA